LAFQLLWPAMLHFDFSDDKTRCTEQIQPHQSSCCSWQFYT